MYTVIISGFVESSRSNLEIRQTILATRQSSNFHTQPRAWQQRQWHVHGQQQVARDNAVCSTLFLAGLCPHPFLSVSLFVCLSLLSFSLSLCVCLSLLTLWRSGYFTAGLVWNRRTRGVKRVLWKMRGFKLIAQMCFCLGWSSRTKCQSQCEKLAISDVIAVVTDRRVLDDMGSGSPCCWIKKGE